ncbi:hypothetical protein X975_12279, partial [Stegodyphus mimosarum]
MRDIILILLFGLTAVLAAETTKHESKEKRQVIFKAPSKLQKSEKNSKEKRQGIS